jgi:hypothetical protein
MSAAAVDVHVDVAAYAIGALDIDEVDAFEGHLNECSRCHEELTWLSQVIRHLRTTARDGS